VWGAALLVWLAAVVGLRGSSADVITSRVVLPAGTPGLLHLPRAPAEGSLPVALLAHDFAGNRGELGFLARRLARAGWAALALDLRGHGRNPAPFDHDGSNRKLARELESALDWVASRPGELDPARVVLVGHGMGALAALQQAQWNPSEIAAVVALAPSGDVGGPYAPPNVLVLWGNRDLPGVRDAGRALGARLAGREQLVGERTYGDPERGTAVRIAELSGAGHWSVLWSQETAERILDWLEPIAPARAAPATERVALWVALGWLAALVLLWELPGALCALWLPEPARSGGSALVRFLGIAAALGASALVIGSLPDGLLPLRLRGAREPLALLFLSGAALLMLAPAAWSGAALRRAGTWLGGAALAGSVYVLTGPLLAPWVDPWPAPQRLSAIGLASAAALPHFAALEWLLRTPGGMGALLPAFGRGLAVALLGAAALAGWLPEGSLTAARALLLGAPLLELLAQRCARAAPNPWASALAQSLWLGWVIGSLFPLDA
jgi:dienelactone hydrolase